MIYIRSEVELDQRYFSNKERLSVDQKLEKGRLLELWEGGPKGSATREAVDLMLWRVRVLNYLKTPDPKVGEALFKDVMTYCDGDSSINATNAPAEFNGIVDEFPSNMDHWRDALGTLWRHQPALVLRHLRHLRDRAFTKRTGILSVISALPHGNIRLLLFELASDPVDSVRQAACTCLSAFKDERSKAVLRRMLTDRVALIRLEALYSLKAIDPVFARAEANRMSGDMVLEYGIRRFLEHVLEKS